MLKLHKSSGAIPSSSSSRLFDTSSSSAVSPTKRRYVADTSDIEIVKKIKLQEIELRDRNTVLRGIKQNVSVVCLDCLVGADCGTLEFRQHQNRIHGEAEENEGGRKERGSTFCSSCTR